jgi:hypothetical protein
MTTNRHQEFFEAIRKMIDDRDYKTASQLSFALQDITSALKWQRENGKQFLREFRAGLIHSDSSSSDQRPLNDRR